MPKVKLRSLNFTTCEWNILDLLINIFYTEILEDLYIRNLLKKLITGDQVILGTWSIPVFQIGRYHFALSEPELVLAMTSIIRKTGVKVLFLEFSCNKNRWNQNLIFPSFLSYGENERNCLHYFCPEFVLMNSLWLSLSVSLSFALSLTLHMT